MPGYRGHLVGGMLFFFITLAVLLHWMTPSTLTIIEWLGCTLAGSLFPDIDTKSKGQRFFYLALTLIFITLILMHRYKAVAFVGLLSLVPLIVHHRGLCHKVWFIIAVPAGIAVLFTSYLPACKYIFMYDAGFFILGALSHLWFDMGMKRMMRW